jgi:hypothetical protein
MLAPSAATPNRQILCAEELVRGRLLTGEANMKTLLVSAAVLGLTASASVAAEMQKISNSSPMVLTDTQLAGVAAGALVNVVAVDVVDAVVAATVQANVLGQAIQSGSSNAQNRNPVAVAGTMQ